MTLPLPTFVVGNVVIGGVGKTPLVQWLAQRLIAKGVAPHVLTLGWGGEKHGGFLRDYRLRPVVRVQPQHSPAIVGDEALEIVTQTTAPVWCGARRGMIAAAHGAGAGCLIVDDGLQHPLLAHAFHILVIDADTPLTNAVFPHGPYREPLRSALYRVRAVVVMLAPSHDVIPKNLEVVLRDYPSLSVVAARMVSGSPVAVSCGVSIAKNAKILAFCAIGRPEKFFASLVAQGYNLTDTKAFPDHHRYTQSDINGLLDAITHHRHGFDDPCVLVTTRKDAVKVQHFLEIRPYLAVCGVSLVWNDDQGDALLSSLDAHLSPYS